MKERPPINEAERDAEFLGIMRLLWENGIKSPTIDTIRRQIVRKRVAAKAPVLGLLYQARVSFQSIGITEETMATLERLEDREQVSSDREANLIADDYGRPAALFVCLKGLEEPAETGESSSELIPDGA